MLPFFCALILLKGLQVRDSVVYRLDLVRYDKLYPWKTSVAYDFFGGNSTVSDILSTLVLGMYDL